MDFEAGNTFWRREEFDPDETAERRVQLWSHWRLLGYLSVMKYRPNYEGSGLSAVAFAYELGGVVSLHPDTIRPDELAVYFPVSPARAAAVLTQYCAEHGRLANNDRQF